MNDFRSIFLFLGTVFTMPARVSCFRFHGIANVWQQTKIIFSLMYFRIFSISHWMVSNTFVSWSVCLVYVVVHGKCQVKATQSKSFRRRGVSSGAYKNLYDLKRRAKRKRFKEIPCSVRQKRAKRKKRAENRRNVCNSMRRYQEISVVTLATFKTFLMVHTTYTLYSQCMPRPRSTGVLGQK